MVLGGSPLMFGAPALVARAAFRGGVGLVKVVGAAGVVERVIQVEPSATGVAVEAGGWVEAVEAADPDRRAVLAVGPGWGDAAGADVAALCGLGRRVVLDADGLNALARTGRCLPPGGTTVMTPHPGEFARLAAAAGLDAAADLPAAKALAAWHGATVVLKGHRTHVVDGGDGRWQTLHAGSPGLATAGTGDVLTGLLASLTAQGLPSFEAAVLAVGVHGEAGRRLGDRGLLAREVADTAGVVLRERAATL